MSQEILQVNVTNFIGVDIYDEYYYTRENTIHKSNNDNDYKNIRYGYPDVVDISNPLQILVLYKLFNKVVKLDNHLNYITEYNIPLGTDLIANAGKNRIWTYNNILQTLSIYNLKTYKINIKSIPITEKITLLKGDLNNAIVRTDNNKLEAYNFVARKTSSINLKNSILPISMHNQYRIKNKTLFRGDKSILKLNDTVVAFEVQNNTLYYLYNSIINKKQLPK